MLTSESWDVLETEDPQLAAQALRHILTVDHNAAANASQGHFSLSVTTASQHTNSAAAAGILSYNEMRRPTRSPSVALAMPANRHLGLAAKRALPGSLAVSSGAASGNDAKRSRFL